MSFERPSLHDPAAAWIVHCQTNRGSAVLCGVRQDRRIAGQGELAMADAQRLKNAVYRATEPSADDEGDPTAMVEINIILQVLTPTKNHTDSRRHTRAHART